MEKWKNSVTNTKNAAILKIYRICERGYAKHPHGIHNEIQIHKKCKHTLSMERILQLKNLLQPEQSPSQGTNHCLHTKQVNFTLFFRRFRRYVRLQLNTRFRNRLFVGSKVL